MSARCCRSIRWLWTQTSKTGFWWGPPHSINDRSVITVSKQIDSNRVVALDLNLSALTGPQIIQGEQRRIYPFPLLDSLKSQLVLGLLIAIILAVIVSVWITNYIRKPVTAITRQFKAAARGELAARIKLKRNDEFTHIADGFNSMMGNIQSLFEDLRVAEEKKRHHELKVLQLQIHPHFLNNTLTMMSFTEQHFVIIRDLSGGALWTGIDTNRGYYDNIAACGALDLYRLPKYSNYLFQSQSEPNL